MRALYEAIIAVTAFTVAASGQALAGGKGGGGGGQVSGDGPKGNISLDYGKIEHTHTPQKADGSLSAKKTGKAHFDEFRSKRPPTKLPLNDGWCRPIL